MASCAASTRSSAAASDFFVNNRIDLMVREAETFRNDYRNTETRDVFLALKKPLPWASDPPPGKQAVYVEPTGMLETQRYCMFFLTGIVIACLLFATFNISRQNRQTR